MKNVRINHKHRAFTIIEVVLVLAIAGLIFLMVFITLPALQRNQRDTQRRNDLAKLKTALVNFRANNRGSLAAIVGSASYMRGEFRTQYLGGDEFKSPSGRAYYLANQSGSGNRNLPFEHYRDMYETYENIEFTNRAKCTGESTEDFGGPSNFAIFILLENGGAHCIDG